MNLRWMPAFVLGGLWTLVLATATSCEQQKATVPTFIKIDTIRLQTFANQGTNSAKIEYAWVAVGNNFLGAFPLPAMVPVVSDTAARLLIQAGVSDNGIRSLPTIYPFYAFYEGNFVPDTGKVVTVNPTVTYSDATLFDFNEEFELTNSFTRDMDGDIITALQLAEFEGYGGSFGARTQLTEANPSFMASTIQNFRFPRTEDVIPSIYMELNYRTNIPFDIGVVPNGGFTPTKLLSVYPRSTWGKLYIPLTKPLSDLTAGMQTDFYYQLVLGATKPDSVAVGELFVDNIKVLRYNQ